jgi:hypothetical protein
VERGKKKIIIAKREKDAEKKKKWESAFLKQKSHFFKSKLPMEKNGSRKFSTPILKL